MSDKRKTLTQKRFGNIDESILGNIKDLKEITWPDITREYKVRNQTLIYRPVNNIEKWAKRIAEIFFNGAYEMINNSEIEWHQVSIEIIKRVNTGDWKFYGCFLDDLLIATESMRIIRGDSTIEWVWGCVDPPFRGMGVWQNIGIYNDLIVKESGAQVGSVWVVTSHKYSQMAVEKAGYSPMGCFIGKRLYGGADNKYYRSTLIHYAKLYNEGKKHLQNRKSMQLTERAGKMVQTVFNLYKKDG